VSSTDGVRDNDETVDWYARVGECGLFDECMGKRGLHASSDFDFDVDFVGDTRSTNRTFSVFLLGICCVEETPATLELASSASPASRRKSTMSASAAFCLPISDGVMRSPSAAVVLFARDMSEADSWKEGLLYGKGR
jgi:hypothetical protein